MAVIKNDKTGTWEVRTYYKDFTGATKQKTKRGFATKREAVDWERAFKLQKDQNMDMYFKDFVEIYISDKKPRVKHNTWLTKQHIIETKILPYFEKGRLPEPTRRKAIRKAMESYRISPAVKAFLRTIP